MEIINDLTEVTNEYVPQQSLQGLTSNGPRLAGMVDDRTKQEDDDIEDKTEVKEHAEGTDKEIKLKSVISLKMIISVTLGEKLPAQCIIGTSIYESFEDLKS